MLLAQPAHITHLGIPFDLYTHLTQCRKHSGPHSAAAGLALFFIGFHNARVYLRHLEFGNLPVAAVVRPCAIILLLKELFQHKLQGGNLCSVTAEQAFCQPIEVATVQWRLGVVVHIESVTVNGTLQP